MAFKFSTRQPPESQSCRTVAEQPHKVIHIFGHTHWGGGDMAEGQSEQSERPKETLATSSMPGGGLRLRKTQSCAPSSAPDSPAWLPTQYRTPFLLLPPRPPPSLLSPATPPPTIDQALPPPPHPACLAKSTKTPQSGNRVQLFKCCSAMLRYFPISSLCTLTPNRPCEAAPNILIRADEYFRKQFFLKH